MSETTASDDPSPVGGPQVEPNNENATTVPEELGPEAALQEWAVIRKDMTALLSQTPKNADWAGAVSELATRVRRLVSREPDTALFVLMQSAGNDIDHYSAKHALLCAVVCDICAGWMEWEKVEVEALVRAALTMNISMASAQDVLAKQAEPLSSAQRAAVSEHAASGAEMLLGAGVTDPLWTDTVRRHDRDFPRDAILEGADRLAQLLRRVDVYTAKLSRRVSREAASPALAARDACLDSTGLPDAIGATLLRCMGLYPPGSCVELRNSELAIVIRRGAKAHTPVVASLRRTDGALLYQPTRRDTVERKSAVVRGTLASELNVLFDPVRVLKC